MSMQNQRRPNLFLVGCMKAGTTTLHRLLDAHPDIFMSKKPKEPSWFVGPNSVKSEEWYLGLFTEGGDARYLGEASTNYTRAPRLEGAPEKIKRYAPDGRILYITRDPLDRALSHYWWEVQFSAEGRSFREAASRLREIRNVGNYAFQIRPYIEAFGRDRVHVLTLESLTGDATNTLSSLWQFLDLPPADVTGGAPTPRFNTGRSEVRRVMGAGVFSHLKETPLWAAAKSILPPQTRKRMISSLGKPVDRHISQAELEEAAAELRPRLLEETEALSKLVGRDFPEWTWLHGGPAPATAR